MTRGLNAAQLAAAAAPSRIVIPLAELFFESGTLRLASCQWNITYGADTYLAVPFSFRESREAEGSLEGGEFSLSGIDPAIIAIAHQEPYRGRVARLLKALCDPDTYAVIGEPLVRFIGRIQDIPTQETNGACDAKVIAEHYEAALARPAPLRLNSVDQQRLYPVDLGCEFVEQTITKDIVWPTKEAMRK